MKYWNDESFCNSELNIKTLVYLQSPFEGAWTLYAILYVVSD